MAPTPAGPEAMGAEAAGPEAAGAATAGPGATLSPETCARAWFALRDAHARVNECLTGALGRECGIGVSDFEVLLGLSDPARPAARISDLATAVSLSQPALSRLVGRLSARGFLVRLPSATDQRAVRIQLTAAGRAVVARAIPLHAACVRDFLLHPVSGDEQATLISILDRLRPATGDPAPPTVTPEDHPPDRTRPE